MDADARLLVSEILREALSKGAFPAVKTFRASHADQRSELDALVHAGHLESANGHYVPTLVGLSLCGTAECQTEIALAELLLARLKEGYRRDPNRTVESRT